MRKIGYARVSSPHQNLDRQIAALRSEHCHAIFREKASGRDIKNRPQLEKAINALGKGDILVLAEWDRATRSMLDGVHIMARIHARGALLKVVDKPYLDLTTPTTSATPARCPAATKIPTAIPDAGQNTATSEGLASKESPSWAAKK